MDRGDTFAVAQGDLVVKPRQIRLDTEYVLFFSWLYTSREDPRYNEKLRARWPDMRSSWEIRRAVLVLV